MLGSFNLYLSSEGTLQSNQFTKTRTIGLLIYNGFDMIDLCGPMEVLAVANAELQRMGINQEAYSMRVLAEKPGDVQSACGLKVIANQSYSDIQYGLDTLFIAGTMDLDCLLKDVALQDWLRSIAPNLSRVAAVSTGAFLLAKCGLLKGRSATCHWQFTELLASAYPEVSVEANRIYVRDNSLLSAGAGTAGIEMTLAMLEDDWNSEFALKVAGNLLS